MIINLIKRNWLGFEKFSPWFKMAVIELSVFYVFWYFDVKSNLSTLRETKLLYSQSISQIKAINLTMFKFDAVSFDAVSFDAKK